jgi:putative DNA primase/helicase
MEESRQVAAPALLKAALAYAGRGVPVFPCESGAKRPLTRNGHWDATTDRRAIERWWERWPSANVGLPTGQESGIVVLDVDVEDGGLDSLARLERVGTPVPKTARTRTGGGGVHIFFRYPGGKEIRNSAGLLGPGLDVRGEGGYVVVPPSQTQGPYEWVDRSPLAKASWLIERLTERDEATLF